MDRTLSKNSILNLEISEKIPLIISIFQHKVKLLFLIRKRMIIKF